MAKIPSSKLPPKIKIEFEDGDSGNASTNYYYGIVKVGRKSFEFTIEQNIYPDLGVDNTYLIWCDKEPPDADQVEEEVLKEWMERN